MVDIITGALLVVSGAAAMALYNRHVTRLIARERVVADELREQIVRLRSMLNRERRWRLADQAENERYEAGYMAGLHDAPLVSDAEQFVTALKRGEHATMKIIRRREHDAA